MPVFALPTRQAAHLNLVGTLSNIAAKRAAIEALRPPTILVAVIEEAGEPARLERIENTLAARLEIAEASSEREIQSQDIGIKGARALVNRYAVMGGAPFSRTNFEEGELIYGAFLVLAEDGQSDLTQKQVDAIDLKYGPLQGRALLS